MLLVGIVISLLVISVAAYCYGAWKLAQYGFRVSGGVGAACLVVPFFGLFFGTFKLEEEGKEFPMAMMLFGLISVTLLTIVFWTPISLVATGRAAELEAPTGVAEAAVAEYGAEAMKKKGAAQLEKAKQEASKAPAPTPTPAPTPNPTEAPANGGPASPDGAAAPPSDAAPKEAAPKEAAPAGQ